MEREREVEHEEKSGSHPDSKPRPGTELQQDLVQEQVEEREAQQEEVERGLFGSYPLPLPLSVVPFGLPFALAFGTIPFVSLVLCAKIRLR